jgi:hypothetical protein
VTQDVSTTGYNTPAYTEGPDDSSSTKDVAKDQAAGVAGSAKDAGQHVAGVAKDEAGNVAAEATRQARDVVGQARAEIAQQASDQQQRVAGGLRSIGTELSSMADRSDQPGMAADLAREASAKVQEVAEWLEQRDPGSLLDEVKTFARRRPGAFLAIALGAGLAAGRLTRGLKDEASGSDVSSGATGDYRTNGSGTASGYTPAAYRTGTGAGYQETAPVAPASYETAPVASAGYETTPVETYPATETTPGTGSYDERLSTGEVIESPPYPGESTSTGYDEGTHVEKTTYTEEERR